MGGNRQIFAVLPTWRNKSTRARRRSGRAGNLICVVFANSSCLLENEMLQRATLVLESTFQPFRGDGSVEFPRGEEGRGQYKMNLGPGNSDISEGDVRLTTFGKLHDGLGQRIRHLSVMSEASRPTSASMEMATAAATATLARAKL